MNVKENRCQMIWMAVVMVFTVSVLSATAQAQSQWTGPDSNNNIYYNSGNVGIGTTSPLYPLDINTNNSTVANFKSSASGTSDWGLRFDSIKAWMGFKSFAVNGGGVNDFGIATGSGGNLLFGTNGGAEVMRLTTDGKVGIGTASPSAALSIVSPNVNGLGVGYQGSGSNRLMFAAEFGGTTSAESNVGFIGYGPTSAGGSARSIAFGAYTGSEWKEVLRMQSGGNVGIGTTDPSTPLSMGGSWGNSGLTVGNGSASAGVVLHSHPSSPYSSLRFATGAGGAYDQGFVLYNHNANFMSFGTARGTRMTIDSSGNLGVGTTSPGATFPVLTRLDVVAANALAAAFAARGGSDGRIAYFATQDFNNSAATGTGLYVSSGAGTGNTHIGLDVFSSGGGAYNNLVLQQYGGSVGIGTPTPSFKLDVRNGAMGVTDAAGNTAASLRGLGSGGRGALEMYDSGVRKTAIYSDANHSYINGGGNFGIGTTAPGYKLEVIGEINATEGLRINGAPIKGSQWNGTDSISYNGGNVGIGTTGPTQRLEVSGGPIKITGGGLFLDDNQAIRAGGGNQSLVYRSPSNGIYYGSADVNDFLVLNAGGSERFRIATSGNVGIGTASPGYKLDVYGPSGDYPGRVASPDGYLLFGPANTSWSYFTTDRPRFYFNTAVTVDTGEISSYNEDLSLQTSGTTRLTINNATGNVGIGAEPSSSRLKVNGEIEATGLSINGTPISSSPWTGTGSISYNGGNVGIGTTSPQVRLDTWTAARSTAYNPGDLTTWADQLVKNPTNSSGAATGIAFQLKDSYHPNAGTGIAAVRSDPANDYQADLAFITRPYQAAAQERMRILSDGKVGIGTSSPGTYKLNVNGDTNVKGNLNIESNGEGTGNIVAAGTINAKYQDVAEWVESSQKLVAGTVVVLDSTKSNQVISSSQSYDTRVAGVISEQPGIALGEKGYSKVLVATTGRVRVKVDASKGPIHIGDLLVTSDVPGIAMKSEPVEFAGRKMHMPGTLIGKALEPLEKGTGTILVLLSLQ